MYTYKFFAQPFFVLHICIYGKKLKNSNISQTKQIVHKSTGKNPTNALNIHVRVRC